ncbi:hypothetical protein UlMin_015863 [Ulmus minor]
MAIGWKLKKLKSAIKRLLSFKFTRSSSTATTTYEAIEAGSLLLKSKERTIYVGKSRRRYLVTSEVADHPLIRELSEKSSGGGIVINCEVVLFEHLLWTMENDDGQMQNCLEELVELYKY